MYQEFRKCPWDFPSSNVCIFLIARVPAPSLGWSTALPNSFSLSPKKSALYRLGSSVCLPTLTLLQPEWAKSQENLRAPLKTNSHIQTTSRQNGIWLRVPFRLKVKVFTMSNKLRRLFTFKGMGVEKNKRLNFIYFL